MVGRHVLVIASRRETRNSVRDTLRPMGLMVDYVATVDEARQFCSSGLPHAIIFEAALAGENFRKLRADWSSERAHTGLHRDRRAGARTARSATWAVNAPRASAAT